MSEVQDHINADQKEFNKQMTIHAENSNKEMGLVHERLLNLESDGKWMKQTLEKIDTRMWWVLGTIILSILIAIYKK